MKLWRYYAWHTFKNSIKKLFSNTFLAIIACIILISLMFGLVGGVIGMAVFDKIEGDTEVSSELVGYFEDDTELSSEAVSETEEMAETEEMDDIEDMDLPEGVTGVDLYETIIFIVIAIFIAWGIFFGPKKGSDIFLMGDVNNLFTAPMKPQSVMMFRLSFQLAGSLAASIYMLFQLPNILRNVDLTPLGIVSIFLGWAMLIMLSKLFNLFSFVLANNHGLLKRLTIPLTVLVPVIAFIPVIKVYMSLGSVDLDAVLVEYSANWLRYIPILGWFKAMMGYAIKNDILMFLIYFGLMIIGYAAMIAVIWNIKIDFYESAISGAEKRQDVLEAKVKNKKPEKKKKFSKRIERESNLKGEGALVFFHKELLTYRRFAFFGIISKSMLTIAGIVALISLALYKLGDIRSFAITAVVIILMIYFRTLENPLSNESNTTWLVLAPDGAYRKVLAVLLSRSLITFIEILPTVLVTAIFTGENPFIVILWVLTFLIVEFMLMSFNTLIDALVPAQGMDLFKGMVSIMLKMFMICILLVASVCGYLLGEWTGALIVNGLFSLVLGAIAFAIYPSMLHNGRS